MGVISGRKRLVVFFSAISKAQAVLCVYISNTIHIFSIICPVTAACDTSAFEKLGGYERTHGAESVLVVI